MTAADVRDLELHWERLPDPVAARAEFAAATPWPHLLLHDVVPASLLDAAAAEIRAVDAARMRSDDSKRSKKRESSDVSLFGPATVRALELLDGDRFVSFLRGVCGIDDLTPDPEHANAGVHETMPGGRSMIHVDFETHPRTGLFHRVNVLVYLNRDWPPEYGGQLELWPDDMSALGRRIEPTFNTLVLFATSRETPHGLPTPVACPAGTSRMSLASYYYSATPAPETRRHGPRSYRARPEDGWWTSLPSPSGVAAAGARVLGNGVAAVKRRARR